MYKNANILPTKSVYNYYLKFDRVIFKRHFIYFKFLYRQHCKIIC